MASASHPFNADLNSESNESSAESSANAVIEDLNSSNEPVASSDETGSPEAGDLEAGNLEVSNPAESGVAHFLRQLSDRSAVEPISAEPISFEQPPELTETPPQGFTGFAGL
ncbi:MAG: hypothetical protein AAF050_19675, partial [Cyanobacteria bacterium J06649_5]